MRAYFVVVTCAVVAGLFGCDDEGDGPPPVVAPPAETAAAVADHLHEPEGTEAPEALAVSVGWTERPPAPTDAQARAVQRALRTHSGGDYDASASAFRAVTEEAPDYGSARFNLACALSRTGDVAGAGAQIARLIEQDMPHYRHRLENDSDLEALRGSPTAAMIRARAAELEGEYETAVRQGAPAVAWGEGYVRAGVWVHSAGRFVPLGGSSRHSVAALTDVDHGVTVTVTKRADRTGDLEYAFGVNVFDLYGARGRLVRSEPSGATQGEVVSRPEGAAGRFHVPLGMEQWNNAPWYTAADEGIGESLPREPPDRVFLYFGDFTGLRDPGFRNDVWYEGSTARYSIRGNTLGREGAEDIELSRGHGVASHHQLVASRDGSKLLALSVSESRGRCSHVIDVVDLAAGTATEVTRGEGVAAARQGGDDALYVQAAETTRRLEDVGADFASADALPEGFGLIAPTCD